MDVFYWIALIFVLPTLFRSLQQISGINWSYVASSIGTRTFSIPVRFHTYQSISQKKTFSVCTFCPSLVDVFVSDSFFHFTVRRKNLIMESGGAGYEAFNTINLILIILSGISYVTLSQIFLYRHRKNIKDQFSTIEKINLNWLQYLILGIGFIWVVVYCLACFLLFD